MTQDQERESDGPTRDKIDATIAERFDEPAREVADADGPQAVPQPDGASPDPADQEGTSEATGGSPPGEDERSREELIAALAAAEQERDEYLDALKRQQAEFQNYRKRAMREGAAERQKGETDVLAKLIEVVDDFELAVLAGENAKDVDSLRKGVEMVYGKLIDVLKGFGLEKIGQEGVAFDPELHEAVQHEHDDEDRDQPVVAEVMRNGYRVNDRVLRPAMVKVVE